MRLRERGSRSTCHKCPMLCACVATLITNAVRFVYAIFCLSVVCVFFFVLLRYYCTKLCITSLASRWETTRIHTHRYATHICIPNALKYALHVCVLCAIAGFMKQNLFGASAFTLTAKLPIRYSILYMNIYTTIYIYTHKHTHTHRASCIHP